jgi:hypothetical protein
MYVVIEPVRGVAAWAFRIEFQGRGDDNWECSFEEFLDQLEPEEQEEFLFHLDVFTETS